MTESLQACGIVSAGSAGSAEAIGAAEEAETLEIPEKTEVTAEIATTEEDEVEDVSMTGEEAIASRARPLQGFATIDTGAHLQRVEELTDMSQAAETTHRPAAAARPLTTVHTTAHPPHPDAAVVTLLAFRALPRRLASLVDAVTTGLHPEMPTTAKTTKASAVMKAADPVRVLLLTSVAHDHPDVTATIAAEDRPPTIADHLLQRNAAEEPRPLCLDHRHAGAAMSQAHVHVRVRVRRRGVVKGTRTRRLSAPKGVTSVGLAQVMSAKAAAPAATSHLRRKMVRWTQRSERGRMDNDTRKVKTIRHEGVSHQHKGQRVLSW